MEPDELHDRLQGLFDRFKDAPESRFVEGGAVLKPDAYAAFLDARRLIEMEVLPLLHQLRR